MRKLLPCLLVAGTVVVSGCNKQSANGTGPGVVAADDPLTYVPADTPYVFANIEPVPANISNDWFALADKAGKVGDIYADDIDTFANTLREENKACGTTTAAEPAMGGEAAPDASSAASDASGGGGGAAMQDPSSGRDDGDTADNGDGATDDTAAASGEGDAGAAPPVAGLSAPFSTEGHADKCSPGEVADREMMVRFMDALKAEVAGKDARGLLDDAGIGTQAHVAFYGLGPIPVLRIELAKPDNLRALVGRLDGAAGSKLKKGKVGDADYWTYAFEKSEGRFELLIAVSGKHLVVTGAPGKASDADLRTLLGIDKPKKSLADDGGLAALNKKMNYLTYGSGYFDSAKLVAWLKAPATPLEKSFLAAGGSGKDKPAVDAVCAAEYDQLAAAWPGANFGYTELSAKHAGLRAVVQTRADIAKDLMLLRAPMPGLAAGQDAMLDFGFSLNAGKLPELANKYADAVAKAPYKCSELVHLNQSFEQVRTNLTNPGFAGYTGMFHGLHAQLDKLVIKADQPIPDFAAVVSVGSDNPAGLLAYANQIPGMATLGLKNDGVAKQLPPMPNLPVSAPMFAAMTDKVLSVSIGQGEEAKIPGAMKSDPAQQPLFETSANGDFYHVWAQILRNLGQKMDNPMLKQSMDRQARTMDTAADLIKRVDLRVELTETGIELHEVVDTK